MERNESKESQLWHPLLAINDAICNTVLQKFLHSSDDVSVKQHLVMKKIYDLNKTYPQGVLLKTLAKEMRLSPATVSELVESLVRKEALKRIQHPDDRRAVLITLTEKSEKRIAEAERKINVFIAELWKDFTEEEKQCTVSCLKRLQERVVALNALNENDKNNK